MISLYPTPNGFLIFISNGICVSNILVMTLTHIKIQDTDIFLDDLGDNAGKITISNTYDRNFSTYWGAMGGDLKSFLLSINEDYFCNRLLGKHSCYTFDAKKTFANFRKFIKQEFSYDLPWYKHLEFQKDMREKINDFQKECDTANYFVDRFLSCMKSFDYSLIDCNMDRKFIRDCFEGICEPWDFIGESVSEDYIWLQKLFKNLKKELKRNKKATLTH